MQDEVWYRSFRNYLESMQSTGILAGSDVEYYEQDPQYAKAGFICSPGELHPIETV